MSTSTDDNIGYWLAGGTAVALGMLGLAAYAGREPRRGLNAVVEWGPGRELAPNEVYHGPPIQETSDEARVSKVWEVLERAAEALRRRLQHARQDLRSRGSWGRGGSYDPTLARSMSRDEDVLARLKSEIDLVLTPGGLDALLAARPRTAAWKIAQSSAPASYLVAYYTGVPEDLYEVR